MACAMGVVKTIDRAVRLDFDAAASAISVAHARAHI
jgi:hypothetical protein